MVQVGTPQQVYEIKTTNIVVQELIYEQVFQVPAEARLKSSDLGISEQKCMSADWQVIVVPDSVHCRWSLFAGGVVVIGYIEVRVVTSPSHWKRLVLPFQVELYCDQAVQGMLINLSPLEPIFTLQPYCIPSSEASSARVVFKVILRGRLTITQPRISQLTVPVSDPLIPGGPTTGTMGTAQPEIVNCQCEE